MVELLYGCGLRVGELVGLDVQPGAGCALEWRIEADGFSARALPGTCRVQADSRLTQAAFTSGEPPLQLRRR